MTEMERIRRPALPHRGRQVRGRLGAAEPREEAVIGRALADVVHDLGGSLTTMFAALQMAELELDSAHPAALEIAAAMRAARDMEALRRWLLSFVRHDDMPCHLLSLNDLVLVDLPMLQRLMSDRASSHVQITARLASDLPLVMAQPTPLRRLLLNLIVNARDACDEQQHGSIVITTAERELGGVPCIVLSVRDNGKGMSAATRQRVFTPGGHTTKGPRGHGRGMAACRRTAAEMGGHLHVASAEGYGTVVTLMLPLSEAEDL